MSEESKRPEEQEQAVPETEAPEMHSPEESSAEAAAAEETLYTFTREQVEQMELAAKQLESVKEQFVRLSAEYDNYRKRTAKERDGIYQSAQMDTIKEFLTVYDNLERAVSAGGDEDSPHRKGLELIFNQYREILKKLGVTEIEALGQPFDPERHNAVNHIEDPDLGENVVSQVLQAGFLLGDRVLRFAIVQVAN